MEHCISPILKLFEKKEESQDVFFEGLERIDDRGTKIPKKSGDMSSTMPMSTPNYRQRGGAKRGRSYRKRKPNYGTASTITSVSFIHSPSRFTSPRYQP